MKHRSDAYADEGVQAARLVPSFKSHYLPNVRVHSPPLVASESVSSVMAHGFLKPPNMTSFLASLRNSKSQPVLGGQVLYPFTFQQHAQNIVSLLKAQHLHSPEKLE